MALGSSVACRRGSAHFTRNQGQRSRRSQRQSRTVQQLDLEPGRRCLGGLADLDGHRSSSCDDCRGHAADRPCRVHTLPSIPLPAPRFAAFARDLIGNQTPPITLKVNRAPPCARASLAEPAPITVFLRASDHFKYIASQSKNVLYQNCAFCGFKIQCPSSGKTTSFDGTPCRCSALKNSKACV